MIYEKTLDLEEDLVIYWERYKD